MNKMNNYCRIYMFPSCYTCCVRFKQSNFDTSSIQLAAVCKGPLTGFFQSFQLHLRGGRLLCGHGYGFYLSSHDLRCYWQLYCCL